MHRTWRAGQHSLQFSGLTTHVSPTVSLPIINAAVSALPMHLFENDVVDPDQVSDAIKRVTIEQRLIPWRSEWRGLVRDLRAPETSSSRTGEGRRRLHKARVPTRHRLRPRYREMLLGDHLRTLFPRAIHSS